MGQLHDIPAPTKFSRRRGRELCAPGAVLNDMFSAAKDAMTSRAAQTYVNGRIGRYGQLQDFHIDSSQRRIEGTCVLHGEATPIKVVVERYEVLQSGGKKFVEVKAVRAARPWLQNLLEDYVVDRRIELPPWAAGAL